MANKGIKLRSWFIHREDYIDSLGNDTGFRDAVAAELASLEHMGERLGVGFVSAPARKEIAPGEWETVAWVFQTETIPAGTSWTPEPVALDEENEGTAPVVEPEHVEA
jgi:hypothetical protein